MVPYCQLLVVLRSWGIFVDIWYQEELEHSCLISSRTFSSSSSIRVSSCIHNWFLNDVRMINLHPLTFVSSLPTFLSVPSSEAKLFSAAETFSQQKLQTWDLFSCFSFVEDKWGKDAKKVFVLCLCDWCLCSSDLKLRNYFLHIHISSVSPLVHGTINPKLMESVKIILIQTRSSISG